MVPMTTHSSFGVTVSAPSHSTLPKAARPALRSELNEDGASAEDKIVTNLSDLPHDVLLLILGFLDGPSLIVCKAVSRLFRSIITTNVLLTYCIELAINGMVDGPPSSGLSIQERLDKLRQYNERFCTGQFTRSIEVKLGHIGLGEMTKSMTPWTWHPSQPDSFGGTVCSRLESGTEQVLMVYTPPSFVEGTSARHWTIPVPLPGGKHILAVDVIQDLVVALGPVADIRKMEFSLLTLESGGSVMHPLAEQPAWEIWLEGRRSNETLTTQIFGPYITWKTPYSGGDSVVKDHLQVRNWKTGRKVWDDFMQGVVSYTFIDTSHLAVLFVSLRARDSDHHGRRPDIIAIYRIQEEPGLPAGCVSTLQLPLEAQATTMLNSSALSSPVPPPSAAFWPDPGQRVVALRLRVSESLPLDATPQTPRPSHDDMSDTDSLAGPCQWYGAILVIPCATFHKHIKRADTTSASAPAPIPWEDWGPRGTILIRGESPPAKYLSPAYFGRPPRCTFPFGSRLTFFSRSCTADGSNRLVTLDANPLARLHPPHPGCTRRDAYALAGAAADEPGVFAALRTTHSQTYYLGPPFPDVEHTMAITQNASGYGVLTRRGDPDSDQTLEAVHVFAIS